MGYNLVKEQSMEISFIKNKIDIFMLFINILFVIIFSYGLELFELHGKNSN